MREAELNEKMHSQLSEPDFPSQGESGYEKNGLYI